MSRSYTSRRIGENVSKYTVQLLPVPTLADIAATVFRQTWQAKVTGTLITFYVLAPNEEHAERFGGMWLAARGTDVSELVVLQNVAQPGASVDMVAAILQTEGDEIKEARQRAYQRLTDGPSDLLEERAQR